MTRNGWTRAEDFFVCVVGNNGDWEEERAEEGDIALYNTFLKCSIPQHQCLFLKDEATTVGNCREKLTRLLDNTTADSTFLFYYGGHGQCDRFSTKEPWYHDDISRIIRKHCKSIRQMYLIDCCASGNFSLSLIGSSQTGKAKDVRATADEAKVEAKVEAETGCTRQKWLEGKEIVCLMSTAPYETSGLHWTEVMCWIEVMMHWGHSNDGTQVPVTLCELLDYMSDEMATVKSGLLTVHMSDAVDLHSHGWLPCSHHGASQHHQTNPERAWQQPLMFKDLSDDSRVTLGTCALHDLVYCKGDADSVTSSGKRALPVWHQATVIGIHSTGRVDLRVCDRMHASTWNIATSIDKLLSYFHFARSSMGRVEAVQSFMASLATSGKYLDFSIPVGIPVHGRWWDGEDYPATTMDWREVAWDKTSISKHAESMQGPCVPVHWTEEDQWSVLPLQRIRRLDGSLLQSAVQYNHADSSKPLTPRDALLLSMQTADKELYDIRADMSCYEEVRCFWPENERIRFFKGNLVDPNTDSPAVLEALSAHAYHPIKGKYCIFYFPDDDSTVTVPMKFLRGCSRRKQTCTTAGTTGEDQSDSILDCWWFFSIFSEPRKRTS